MPADEAPLWGFAGASSSRTRVKNCFDRESFTKMSLLSGLELSQTFNRLFNHDALQRLSLQTSLSLESRHHQEHPQPREFRLCSASTTALRVWFIRLVAISRNGPTCPSGTPTVPQGVHTQCYNLKRARFDPLNRTGITTVAWWGFNWTGTTVQLGFC